MRSGWWFDPDPFHSNICDFLIEPLVYGFTKIEFFRFAKQIMSRFRER
jgi:hypothetical protein